MELEAAQRKVEEAERDLHARERELEELRADRRVAGFIRERNLSGDYTQRLGTVARVRRDFERLDELLAEARRQREKEEEERRAGRAPAGAEAEDLPRIDRIILYVDDLDRCPEDRVVEVLQAVHLLLAFRLFVVVVAVDSRWLLHSLRQHSAVFRSAPNDGEGLSDEERLHWRSTPLNYLEKIFQIPFTLKPMRYPGFGEVIDSLTHAPADDAGDGRGTAGAAPAPRTDGGTGEGAAGEVVSPPEPADNGRDEAKVDVNPESLQIQQWERAAMKRLFPLIPSPRAAKRFVNVYRLMRAMVDDADRDAFVGTAEYGHHRCALLLLALLTGHPTEATEILRGLLRAEPGQNWADFLEGFRPAAAPSPNGPGASAPGYDEHRWDQLFDRLDAVEEGLIPSWATCAEFQRWAPQVARFSFHSGRVVIDSQEHPS